jgi:purine-cytosine permease-like protein
MPMDGLSLLKLIKYAAVLFAAIIIGNWFLAETRKAKTNKEPWYKPYASVPGLIILAALSLPLILLLIDD